MTRIDGEVATGFSRVADVFRENFARRGEIGASVCVFFRGERVVDLWGGLADRARRAPWERDTVGIAFSATKGLTAACALVLVDRGALELDAPVARYWPGFAQRGKAGITVRQLLNHRAGLCAVDRPIALADLVEPERLALSLEAQAPLWSPGASQGYGAVAFGLYVGELLRRVAGVSLGRLFAEAVARPLGVDAWIGAPVEVEPRVARLYPADNRARLLGILPRLLTGTGREGRVYRAVARGTSLTARALGNPVDLGPRGIRRYDSREVRALELPWANAVTHARALATVYAALIGDVVALGPGSRLVSQQVAAPLAARQSWVERDEVLLKPLGFAQGFMKEELHLFSPDPESFGHPGAGGALGWANPRLGLAVGYVMNRMDHRIRSPRAIALAQAAHAAAVRVAAG